MPQMISYSLNWEDVVLARAFAGRTDGCYIDIGAFNPLQFSNTMHFYQLGWRGINIEPNPSVQEDFRRQRPGDTNLCLGVSDKPGTLPYYEVSDSTGLSTFSKEEAETARANGHIVKEHSIEVVTLASICEKYVGDRTIDFLSIDVEGHEQAVLAGADFNRWRPRVIVIEATRPKTNILVSDTWQHFFTDANYILALFDGVNQFYVRREDSSLLALLSYPANVLDDAVRHREVEQWELLLHYRRFSLIRILDSLRGRSRLFARLLGDHQQRSRSTFKR